MMEDELSALREEVAALRKEVAILRAERPSPYYWPVRPAVQNYDYSGPPAQPYYPFPVTCAVAPPLSGWTRYTFDGVGWKAG